MIKRLWTLNKILWKQYLYKHRCWLILLFAAAIGVRIWQMQQPESEPVGLSVGIYAEDEDGKRLSERLQGIGADGQIQTEEGVLRFKRYENRENMLRDVKNGTLECGYVLPEDFFEHISEGEMRKQILLYYSASSGAHKLSYEVVFSHLFGMLSDEILTDWLAKSGVEDSAEKLLERKDDYEAGDATFSFIFEHVGTKQEKQEAVLDVTRGLSGIMIFFLALLGLANCLEMSEKKGAFGKHEMHCLEQWSLHIAVLGSVMAGGVFLLVAGSFGQPLKELLGLAAYFIMLEIYLRILRRLLPTPGAVYGAIPVLLLGSILLCPVFFRMETFIPAVGTLGKIFPVYWYLNIFI